MAKKSFAAAPKPKNQQLDKAIDGFVKAGPGKDEQKVASTPKAAPKAKPVETEVEPLTRLSVDLPESLKHEYKVLCAQHKIKIRDDIEALITKRVKQLKA